MTNVENSAIRIAYCCAFRSRWLTSKILSSRVMSQTHATDDDGPIPIYEKHIFACFPLFIIPLTAASEYTRRTERAFEIAEQEARMVLTLCTIISHSRSTSRDNETFIGGL